MRRWRAWVLAALVVWIVIVAWWALSPVSDSVPTGLAENRDGALVPTAQTVECDSPLSGNTKPTEPLPALSPPRAYQRTPCEMPHENDRVIFAIDALIVFAVLALLVGSRKPSAPSPALEDATSA